jgi:hypothetical protein
VSDYIFLVFYDEIICYVTIWLENKVRELGAVKVLHASLLNTTAVAFKVLPFGSYAPMPSPSSSFKIILEMVLWNGLQTCRCITPYVINVIKMPSFQYFFYLREQKKALGARSGEKAGCSNTINCLVGKNSLKDSAV